MDGEVLQVILPSEEEVSMMVSTSERHYKQRLGMFLIKSSLGQFMHFIYGIYAYITPKSYFRQHPFLVDATFYPVV